MASVSSSIRRRLFHVNRSSFGMKDWIWGQNNVKIDTVDHTQKNDVSPAQECTKQEVENHIQSLAESISDSSIQWTEVKLQNPAIKAKVLMSCESNFSRSVPNRSLSSIKTFGDLLDFYNTPTKQPPGALFPNIRANMAALPPNLSIEFPPKPKPKTERKPFQNFNDPRHEKFPNKKKIYHRY